jgi:mannose-6-phosphate isomerase-like protein (cupin superfamily)
MLSNTDYGPEPFTVNIQKAACQNNNFRTALWTGNHLQLTLMSIPAGGEIGLEMHEDTDQFIRLESGNAIVKMGSCKNKLNFQKRIGADDAVFVPAGTWHNIINTGCRPLKVYSIYAPPKHPRGTIHQTKAIADAAEY